MEKHEIRSAVITGPTGAIGTALCRELVGKGIKVYAVCRPNSARVSSLPLHPLVSVVECDVSDMPSLPSLIKDGADAFFHFAWAGTAGPMRNDAVLQSKNINYSLDAVMAAKALGCHTFVGAGSQAEYGRHEGSLTPETPTFPETGYGIAKLCAGQLTRMLASQNGLRHIWMRVLSVYGTFDGEGSMVISCMRRMLAGEAPQFTKGEQQWDYLYSDDAARAFLLAAECGRDGAVYPLGGGKATALKNYIFAMRDAAAPTLDVKLGDVPYQKGQVMYLCADISALQQDTGWQPTVSFEEGIAKTAEWLRTHPKA